MPTNPHSQANNAPTLVSSMSLGGQLRALRELLRLSQADVAVALSQARLSKARASAAEGGGDKITAEAIGNWERNQRNPRKRQDILDIAAFFHERNPAAITIEMIEKLVAAYDPTAPLTAEERLWLLSSDREPPPTDLVDDPCTPFVTGRPLAHPRHFFGHSTELKQLFRLWVKRPLESASIVGPRLSGKTSLLYYLRRISTAPLEQLRPDQLRNELPQPERYRWSYVDFRNPLMGRLDDLLRHVLDNLSLPVPQICTIENFMRLVSTNLHTPAIILLDDLSMVQRYPDLDYNLWNGLRSLAHTQTGGNLAFVVTSSEHLVYSPGHKTFGSPFFNFFSRTMLLGPLSESEARELIDSSPICLPTADVEWILDKSQCWPAVLQILCRERLHTLESGVDADVWRVTALTQMAAFRHLLESQDHNDQAADQGSEPA